jgi:putative transposase
LRIDQKTDNGSSFVVSWSLRACASLGIKLVHSTLGRAQGPARSNGFRSVREQFLVEFTQDRLAQVADLAELNRLFTAMGRDGLPPDDPLRDRDAAAAPLA